MMNSRRRAHDVAMTRQGRVLRGDLGEPRIVPPRAFDVAQLLRHGRCIGQEKCRVRTTNSAAQFVGETDHL